MRESYLLSSSLALLMTTSELKDLKNIGFKTPLTLSFSDYVYSKVLCPKKTKLKANQDQ